MSNEITDQIIEKLKGVSNCLVLLSNKPNGDSIAAALALRAFLHKLDKEVSVASAGALDSKFAFLEGFPDIVSELKITKNFVIEVATKRAHVDEFSYRKEADRLVIFIKPKSGEFRESDVSFTNSDFPFGMIITVGVSGLDQLGEIYSNNAEMFFETPILNIDYRAANESYGQYNFIQLNSTSVSEIVMDLISRYEASLLDETIATHLLTGIIAETNSFQHIRTSPQTFLKASQLVSLGAKQQEIVTQLYRNKSLNFLKLWGRALARLKQDDELGIVHTVISRSDLDKSEADDADAEQVISEMAVQLKQARVLMVFLELTSDSTQVLASLPPILDPQTIFSGMNPVALNPHTVKFTLPSGLTEAETRVLGLIRDELSKIMR